VARITGARVANARGGHAGVGHWLRALELAGREASASSRSTTWRIAEVLRSHRATTP
jgi:hypothetical protein